MNSRTGFVLDAKSMDIKVPRVAPTAAAADSAEPAGTPVTNKQSKAVATCSSKDSAVSNAASSLAHSDLKLANIGDVTHHAQCVGNVQIIPTDDFRNRLKRLRDVADSSGDAARMSFELNNIFLHRLEEIDKVETPHSDAATSLVPQLRLVTCQEWLEMLLIINDKILSNVQALEDEAFQKISNCFQSVRGEQQQALEENRKLRKDLCAIIKLVQKAYHSSTWDLDELCLETMTVQQLVNAPRGCENMPESESEKTTRSLAGELAVRHDEICHLHHQMTTLEEMVLTARQKLILKDQCIAQLNEQLTDIRGCLSNMSQNHEAQTASREYSDETKDPYLKGGYDVNSCKCMIESLDKDKTPQAELMRMVNLEIEEVLQMQIECNMCAMDKHKKTLSCLFEQIDTERLSAIRKLKDMRQELQSLGTDVNNDGELCDAGSNLSHDDDDMRLFAGIRTSIYSLNNSNKALHGECQSLKTQYNMLQVQYDSDNWINERNKLILKEIADLIRKTSRSYSDFSYENIYDESTPGNPFVSALIEINKLSNEAMKCELKNLHDTLRERDCLINQLNSIVQNLTDANDHRRLQDEIFELKQKNSDQSRKLRELTSLLKKQETDRMELLCKYQQLGESFEQQSAKLKKSNSCMQNLKEKFFVMEKYIEELKAERKLLREEIVSLKEKEAQMMGRDRCLSEKLKSSQQDCDKQRQCIHDMQMCRKREEQEHRRIVQELEQANDEIRQKMCNVGCQCKDMQNKLKQLTEVNRQQEQLIASFQMWKEAQLKTDDIIQKCKTRDKEHINQLLEEKQRLQEDISHLYRDNALLNAERKRLKKCLNTPLSMDDDDGREFGGGTDISKRMQFINETKQRLAKQSRMLHGDSDSSSVDMPQSMPYLGNQMGIGQAPLRHTQSFGNLHQQQQPN